MSFAVLFVCTGNVCRSPMAAALLAHALDPVADAHVASAGIRALVGEDIDGDSLAALRELGVDPPLHQARQLRPDAIQQADLVLTAEAGQRATVVRADPLAFRRTFTMREFVRLGDGLPALAGAPTAERSRSRVAEVAAQRGIAPALRDESADDIADPFGRGSDAAMVAVHEVRAAVLGLLRVLGLDQVAG